MTEASITAVIVGLMALGGVLLGRYLERSSEAMKWRRDRCLEAYTDMLQACDMVLNEANKAHVMEEPAPQASAQNALLYEKVAEMHRLRDMVSLIGSDEIEIPVSDLTMYYHLKIAERAIRLPKPLTDEWNTITAEAAKLYRTVAVLARKDLLINPLPWWKKLFRK